MILADSEFEKTNIQEFLKTASLKEGFILSIVDAEISYSDNLKVNDSIDKLVKLAFHSRKTTDFSKSMIEAITEADDLIDLYTIEKCFEALVDIHPVTNVRKKVAILFSAIDKYNDKYELKIKRRVFLFILTILIVFGGIISYVIPTFWDKYNLEPLTVVSQIIFSILIIALTIYFFLFHKIDDNKSILTHYINKRLVKINKRLNIDLEKINELRNQFENE